MPSGPRPTNRPGAGPGRRKPGVRSGTVRTSQTPFAPPPATEPVAAPDAAPSRRSAVSRFRSNVTGRAIALAVVLLILVISYASSLRIYVEQAQEIAATKAEISQRSQRIAELQAEKTRWDDPAYVAEQARDRLGWVVPGEIGYVVVDPAGKPLGGGARIEAGGTPAPSPTTPWWTKVWDSVETADRPAPPASARKTAPPTLTEGSNPQSGAPASSPTPR